MLKTDVVIVGAGAVGCAIARELSKYHVDVVVVDKRDDVGGDASKSNSGIICSGYDAYPDTLESKLIVAANPMFDKLAAELEFPFVRCGAILPAFTDEQYEKLPSIKENAFKNHVYDIEYLSSEQILAIEQCDLADAITSFSWAQYSYNAALKMGNSILSETQRKYYRSLRLCTGSGRECICKRRKIHAEY